MSVKKVGLNAIIHMGLLDDGHLVPASIHAKNKTPLGFSPEDASSLRLTCRSINSYLREPSQFRYERLAYKIFHQKTVGPIPELLLTETMSRIEYLEKNGVQFFDLFEAFKELRAMHFSGAIKGQSMSSPESRQEVIELLRFVSLKDPGFAKDKETSELISEYRKALLPLPWKFDDLVRKRNDSEFTSYLYLSILAGYKMAFGETENMIGRACFLFAFVVSAYFAFAKRNEIIQISDQKKEFLQTEFDKDLYADRVLFKDIKEDRWRWRFDNDLCLPNDWPETKGFGFV